MLHGNSEKGETTYVCTLCATVSGVVRYFFYLATLQDYHKKRGR